MSRTIRNTKLPQSKKGFRRWHSYFNPLDVALLRTPPERYETPRNVYKYVDETHTRRYYSERDRIYVSKGVPGAQMTADWTWDEVTGKGIARNERWYIMPPDETYTYRRKVYVGPNKEWDDVAWDTWTAYERIFNHVRKQGASNRHSGPVRRDKAVQTAKRRASEKRQTALEIKLWRCDLAEDIG